MFGLNDPVKLGDGLIQVVVDQQVIVGGHVFRLFCRPAQPAADLFLGLGAAFSQTAGKFFGCGRRHKDEDRSRQLRLDFARALDFDLENDVLAGGKLFLNVGARCSVLVILIAGVLDQLVLIDHACKGLFGDEEIIDSFLLALTGR